MTPKLFLAAGLVLGGSAAALALVAVTGASDPFAPCRSESMIDFAKIGGAFSLIDETGQSVTEADVFTRPTLFYLGYTFCPDVCPLDNMRNADTVYLMAERGIDVQAVFVSVDPRRDTPEDLAMFTDLFHPEMLGLTGTEDAVASLAEDYASYFKVQDPDDAYYLIDHTTYTYVVLPGHGVVDIVQRDTLPEDAAETLACLIESV